MHHGEKKHISKDESSAFWKKPSSGSKETYVGPQTDERNKEKQREGKTKQEQLLSSHFQCYLVFYPWRRY